MANAFARFDHDFQIDLIRVVPGYQQQTTPFQYVPESTSTTQITGNFDTGIMDMDTQGPDGFTIRGRPALFTEADVRKGDLVRIYFDEAATMALSRTYRVRGEPHDTGWIERRMGGTTVRREWELELAEAALRPDTRR